MFQSRLTAAAVLAAGLMAMQARPALAQSASATDPSYYNNAGPGVVNMTTPTLGLNTTPHVTAPRRIATGATSATDPTLFATSGPGEVAALNPAPVAASGYGPLPYAVASRAPRQSYGPESVDAATYNNAGPGQIAALNPHLRMPGSDTMMAKTARHVTTAQR